MKYYFSIKLKLILYILAITLGAVFLLGLISYKVSERELKSELNEKFSLISALKVNKIQNYFSQIESSISLIENNKYIRSNLPYFSGLLTYDPETMGDKSRITEIILRQLNYIKGIKGINNIALISSKGEQLFTTGHIDYSNSVIRSFSTDFGTNTSQITYSDNYYVLGKNNDYEPRLLAKASFNLHEHPVFIICELNLSSMINDVKDTTSLKSTGESIIFRKKDGNIIYINPLRHDKNLILKDTLKASETTTEKPEFLAMQGQSGFGEDIDYRGEKVLAYWNYIPKIHWGIITKMDMEEAYESIDYLKGISIIIGLFILIFTTLVITVFADNFIKPIIDIKNNLVDLYNGAFPKTLFYKSNDEIKQTTDAINALVDRLKVSTEFASKIGKGDLSAELDTSEYGDVLNKSLMNMRDNIALSNQNEEQRNWAMLGQAYLSESLRMKIEDINEWTNNLLAEICRYTDAMVGVFYIKTNKGDFKPIGSFAFDIQAAKTVKEGQSLIGQAATEKKHIVLNKQPEHYLKISSTLGQMPPTSIVIIPLVYNDSSEGVIELGFLKEMEDYKTNFLMDFGKSIASILQGQKK